MKRMYLLAACLLVALLSLGGALALFRPAPSSTCPLVLDGRVVRSELESRTFGAVTTFSLPAPERWPNAIAVAPDGSVWFGEEAVPALAHLYVTNGTLVEYPLPGHYLPTSAPGYDCSDKTYIWGVALWDGRVWATDSAQNRLVGLSPANDTFKVVSLAANDSLPYTLTSGPDGALWFTQVNSGQIGALYPNGSVAEHSVRVPEYLNGTSAPVYVPGVPAQVAFANSSVGYYVDASPLINGSAVFAFNPEHFSPTPVGGNYSLADPDSIALGGGSIWLAQHGDSSLARYDPGDGGWTVFPTSSVGYIGTTLPYFVETNGSLVWFNEHFGNRMAVIDLSDQSLTEYSLSAPAAANMSQIDNALTFALGGGRAWFTESTSDAVGFIDASYTPSFSISANASSALTVHRGGSASLQVDLRGNSSSPISALLSESSSSSTTTGANITLRADAGGFASLAGSQSLRVRVDVGAGAAPGRYTLMITATDGLISRSLYVQLSVLP